MCLMGLFPHTNNYLFASGPGEKLGNKNVSLEKKN